MKKYHLQILLIALSLLFTQSCLALDLYSERSMALFKEIQCPTCHSQTIDASESSDAQLLRSDVLRLISEGKSDDQIRKTIADKYGNHIVKDYSNPIMKTWVYAVMGFIVIIYFILIRKRRKRK